MRTKWTIIALVFSVVVNLVAMGTIGFHWWKVRRVVGPPLPPFPPSEAMLRPLRRPLNLTPDQMQELGAQRRRISEEIRGIRKDLFESRARLMQLLRSPDPDSMAVEEILQEIASSQVALERKVIHSILRMKQTLTPEQREKLLRMMERRGGWSGFEWKSDSMGPRPGHGMMRGPSDPGRMRRK